MASVSGQAVVVGGGLAGMSLKGGAKNSELAKPLCENSGVDVEGLLDKFNVDVSLVARLGYHHRRSTGCVCDKGGASLKEFGQVIFSGEGFGADFTLNSLLAAYRPDSMSAPALTVVRSVFLDGTTTYALIQMVDKIAEKSHEARIIAKARVTELIMSGSACLINVWSSARKTELLTRQPLTRKRSSPKLVWRS